MMFAGFCLVAVLCALLIDARGESLEQWSEARSARKEPMNPSSLVAEKRGGSNFVFFGLAGCDRRGFAVLPNYLGNKKVIDNELKTMYEAGQRRLRVSLPVLTEQARLDENSRINTEAFLTTVLQTGFQGLLVVIGGGRPPPQLWKKWDEKAYQNRWGAIRDYRAILLSSKIPYMIDLLLTGR